MKVSIVTISYNQGRYLEQALVSVLEQDYDSLEYIVVDAGSTDGSREILSKHAGSIDRLVLEPDRGPADGLNKGFGFAAGDLFGFLNADDYLLPGAVSSVVRQFERHPAVDVLSGNALVVDAHGVMLRRTYSDLFSLARFAYGVCILVQPSTFFTRRVFHRAGGFDPADRIAWDADLFLRMALAGARFRRFAGFVSAFRVHPGSITGAGKAASLRRQKANERFVRVMGREPEPRDRLAYLWLKAGRYLTNPLDVWERIWSGPIAGRAS